MRAAILKHTLWRELCLCSQAKVATAETHSLWGESCIECVGMSMYWNLSQIEQTLCAKSLYTMQHTGTCVFTGVVARLTADFTWEPESPNRVTDSERPLQQGGKIQTTLFHFFLSFTAVARASSMLGTDCFSTKWKFTNVCCKMSKFTKPSPQLKIHTAVNVCSPQTSVRVLSTVGVCMLWTSLSHDHRPAQPMSFFWNDLNKLSFKSSPMWVLQE